MHQFNQTYAAIIESTRRDFLKQATGAIASMTSPMASHMASPLASTASHVTGQPNFGYELSNTINIPTLTELFRELWKNRDYSLDEFRNHVRKSYGILRSAKRIDARTAKMLLAYNIEGLNLSATLKSQYASQMARQMNLDDEQTREFKRSFSHDANLEGYLDMLMEFLATGNQQLFEHLWPLDIMIDNKIVMTKQQALQTGVFSPVSALKATMRQEFAQELSKIQQRKPKQLQSRDDIEYSPADYKGGWQHDADYQSLSMGESTIAENNIHDAVRPGILKRQTSGKLTCTKARALKSKQSNKGNNTAKAAQRYINYHC